jgi:hypothetical protein
MARGNLAGAVIGNEPFQLASHFGNPTSVDLKAADAGICFRFMARSTKDIKGVRLSWGTVTSGHDVTLTVEGVDANGKPDGTPYDVQASLTFTPSSGSVQLHQFAVTPIAGLVVGTMYAITLVRDGNTATAEPLYGYWTGGTSSVYPTCCLTSATGSTRSSFAEVSNSVPAISLLMDDDTEECQQFAPLGGTAITTYKIYGAVYGALRFTTLNTYSIVGIRAAIMATGAVASMGDLIVEIRDLSGNVISGTSVTLPKGSMVGMGTSGGHSLFAQFTSTVNLPAGTYQVWLRQSGDAGDTSNYYSVRLGVPWLNSACAGGQRWYTSSNSGSTWTETTTGLCNISLCLDADVVPDFPAVGNVTEDDTVNLVTGTYHEATEAEVESGVHFGAGSALTGSYAGGGGGGLPILGGSVVR